MKKAAAVSAAVIICAGLAVGGYLFLNSSENKPSEEGDTSSTTSSTTPDKAPEGSGGNSDIAGYIEVTVSEDKYLYENNEISYDDLIKVLDELEENTAVRIIDENATLKAYESLTKALDEREIIFEEAE